MPQPVVLLRAFGISLSLRALEFASAFLVVWSIFLVNQQDLTESITVLGLGSVLQTYLVALEDVSRFYMSTSYLLFVFPIVFAAIILLDRSRIVIAGVNAIVLLAFGLWQKFDSYVWFPPFSLVTDVIDDYSVMRRYVWLIVVLCNFLFAMWVVAHKVEK